jgi:hypothetical protein
LPYPKEEEPGLSVPGTDNLMIREAEPKTHHEAAEDLPLCIINGRDKASLPAVTLQQPTIESQGFSPKTRKEEIAGMELLSLIAAEEGCTNAYLEG